MQYPAFSWPDAFEPSDFASTPLAYRGTLSSCDLFCGILVGSPWGIQFCISVWINANRLLIEHDVVPCTGPHRKCSLALVPKHQSCWMVRKSDGQKRGWRRPPADELLLCVSIQSAPSLWADGYQHRYDNTDAKGHRADARQLSAWHRWLEKQCVMSPLALN